MPRIPAAELERLKSEISLVRLVEAAGVKLEKKGADHHGRCPFHDDRTPSLVISEDRNLWHCLGACQTGGSVIDWVMKAQGVSFRHAVELLRDGAVGEVRAAKQSTVCQLDAPISSDAEDDELLAQVIDYYHETLKQSPEAMDYVTRRGLSAEAVEHFKLGFANRTLGYRLPQKNRKAGAEMRGALQRIGIIRESGHEHFNGSLVVPVIDETGRVTEVYGRKIIDRLRKGTPKHLYLPGPHRGVFNLDAFAASDEMILCESLIDALTFWSAGYRNVTTAYGVEGFTDEIEAEFKEHGIQRVLIAFDRDAAGDKAAEKIAKRLMAAGLDAFQIQFPKGMDANEYALQVQPASKSLGVVIRSAVWLGKGTAPAINTGSTNLVVSHPSLAADVVVEAVDEPEPTPDPVLPATPVPAPPADLTPATKREIGDHSELHIERDDRRYRVRGLEKNTGYASLRINLMVAGSDGVHVDTLDLYQSRQRQAFTKAAAIELGIAESVIRSDLAALLLRLETEQETLMRKTLESDEPTINDDERGEALRLLKNPDLIDQLLADFEACGLVGETTNKLVAYLAAVSRLLPRPLAVLVQSTSAAGKSTLMDAVLRLLPTDHQVRYSAMTGQSLFYLGEQDLKHKVLAIAEEEGVHQASYALKLLQSEGELTIASTGKDPDTGQLITQSYHVEGPVMIMLSTTAIDLDEELLNRCLVLTVSETRSQTRAIHDAQRKGRTLEGLVQAQAREVIKARHHNAQRLLEPLAVVNPYAEQLTFVDDRTRTRRDHEKYLTLIDAIALLHQHQRPVKAVSQGDRVIRYVEVELADIELANRLAHEVLGRSLDELPPQTRTLLGKIVEFVRDQEANTRFSRRELRDATGWGDTQLKVHLARLVDLEYLICHVRGRQFVYELAFDGEANSDRPHLPGLINTDALQGYDAERSGSEAYRSGSESERSPHGRGPVGPRSGGGRGAEISDEPSNGGASGPFEPETAENAVFRPNGQNATYPHVVR